MYDSQTLLPISLHPSLTFTSLTFVSTQIQLLSNLITSSNITKDLESQKQKNLLT